MTLLTRVRRVLGLETAPAEFARNTTRSSGIERQTYHLVKRQPAPQTVIAECGREFRADGLYHFREGPDDPWPPRVDRCGRCPWPGNTPFAGRGQGRGRGGGDN